MQGNFLWENAIEKAFDFGSSGSSTGARFCCAGSSGNGRGTTQRADHRVQRFEFASRAAPPQQAQQKYPSPHPSSDQQTAQPAAVAAAQLAPNGLQLPAIRTLEIQNGEPRGSPFCSYALSSAKSVEPARVAGDAHRMSGVISK